jgi:adenine/guanine phosphoribosyltransferase-like PRPP-binding protein
MSVAHFTEPTVTYWQEFQSKDKATPPPWKYGYPASLPDSRILMLPIRQLKSNPLEAVASLILNQASITVHDELGEILAEAVRDFEPEMVIGLPTLGLGLASVLAKSLGMGKLPSPVSFSLVFWANKRVELNLGRYVPLGYSRKFWCTDTLSTEVSSITSPSGLKKLYLDPNQLSLVRGTRVIIIDDTVSSGKTLQATWDFLEGDAVGCQVLGAGVAMKQGDRWKALLGERQEKVRWVFESPLLLAVEGGWDVRD